MYYFYDDEHPLRGTTRHIIQPLHDGGMRTFPMTDDNPNTAAYLAWVAEGNEATEWTGN